MHRFKNILFVADTETQHICKPALARAITLAENTPADLTVVTVIPRLNMGLRLVEGGLTSDEMQAAAIAEHQRRLDSLIESHGSRLSIRSKVLTGTPHLEIISEVLAHAHDLVIRPPENPGWLSRLFGSDDMNLLRKCPCPVWLIKCKGSRSFRRILAAVDVDDTYQPLDEQQRAMNRQILEIASALALSEFAELHVAHIWDAIGETLMRGTLLSPGDAEVASYVDLVRQRGAANLNALLSDLAADLGAETMAFLNPKTHLIKGRARTKIPSLVRRLGVDLIVMGTVARGGVPGFIMGNTAETILQQVDCSVLAIKPPGFVTPVAPRL
ncbi:MAG: universal stress protein, UspA [Sphingobacteriia bacterium]|nr:universal stress protein, UspA [Sphingobacteriia bacterium]NCC40494.1 universal stress protein, UspA [Gammaproteobacteria bacterium]